MRPPRFLSPLLAAVLCLTAAALAHAQAWSGRGRLQGQVVDEHGKPVEGAEIVLSFEREGNGPAAFASDKKGRFSYLGLVTGNWNVLVRYPGYKESVGTVGVNEFGATETFRVELVPDAGSAIANGERLMDGGRFAEARAEFEKAMANLTPERQVLLRTRIGDTYLREGAPAAAREQYEAALPQLEASTQIPVRLHLADALRLEGRHAEARGQYELLLPQLARPEEKVQMYLQIARSHGMEQNNAAAIQTLETALALAPADPAILQTLADLLSREGREEEARGYLARLPADAQVPADLVMNIGIRMYNDGNLDGALQQFERAVRDNPGLPEAYYYRGLVYLAQRSNDLARADFEKLLALAPGHEKAAEVQEFVKYLAGGR